MKWYQFHRGKSNHRPHARCSKFGFERAVDGRTLFSIDRSRRDVSLKLATVAACDGACGRSKKCPVQPFYYLWPWLCVVAVAAVYDGRAPKNWRGQI
jgi:hypothetical protein